MKSLKFRAVKYIQISRILASPTSYFLPPTSMKFKRDIPMAPGTSR